MEKYKVMYNLDHIVYRDGSPESDAQRRLFFDIATECNDDFTITNNGKLIGHRVRDTEPLKQII